MLFDLEIKSQKSSITLKKILIIYVLFFKQLKNHFRNAGRIYIKNKCLNDNFDINRHFLN